MKQSLFHSKYNLQIYREGNTVINISDTSYEYQIEPSSPIIQRRSLSNAVNTEVRTANVSAIKSANRSITRIGQIITYTVAVTNAGTIPITNTLLLDAIASAPHSFQIAFL